MIYLALFTGFLKVGLFSFGGGYAAIPLIRDVVMSYGWIGEDMLTYMIAVSESTPGPIMVNLATYVGISQAGMPGAVIATFAVVLPAFLIIIGVIAFLSRMLTNPCAEAVLQGLKSCVTGIILATGVRMVIKNCLLNGADGRTASLDLRSIVVTAVLAVLYGGSRVLAGKTKLKKLTPIQLIGISALAGMIAFR